MGKSVEKLVPLQVEIPAELRAKVATMAGENQKSMTKFVRDLLVIATEKADEERIDNKFETRFAALEKTTTRIGTRLENLFALVRSIEDDEQARRRAERAHFVEAVTNSYAPLAEALVQNSAAIEALATEIRAANAAGKSTQKRLDQQAIILSSLLLAAEAKGARRAYAEIHPGVTEGHHKLHEYLAAALARGKKGE